MNNDKEGKINLGFEENLLLSILQNSFNSDVSQDLNLLLPEDFDGDYFFKFAKKHNVIPLIYENIKQNFPDLLPQKVVNLLHQFYENNALHNLFLSKELLTLMDILQQNDIDAFPYKGPVLASYLYNNIALRCSTDLDLIVLPKNFSKVQKVLEKEGYKLVSVVSKQERFKAPLYWRHEYILSKFEGKLLIDVHQNIAGNNFFFPFNINCLWNNLDTISFLNRELKQISLENLLLILSAHGSKHGWENLIWLYDLATLIKLNPQLNFDEVLLTAKNLFNERMILLSLYLCQTLFNIKLPNKVIDKIQSDNRLKRLSEKVIKNMFLNEEKTIINQWIFDFYFYVQIRENWQGKFKQLWASISFLIKPNLRDWDFLPLPKYLYFIYYFIRPFRLILRHFLNKKQ